jgi:hypothetical protein
VYPAPEVDKAPVQEDVYPAPEVDKAPVEEDVYPAPEGPPHTADDVWAVGSDEETAGIPDD